jgi:hypothetical protein
LASILAHEAGTRYTEVREATAIRAPIFVLQITALAPAGHRAANERQLRRILCKEAMVAEPLRHRASIEAAIDRDGLERSRRLR